MTSSLLACLVELLKEGSMEDFIAFVKSNPKSLQVRDATTGRIALHEAVIHCDQVSASKLQELLESYPAGAAIRDNVGRLPLHYATSLDDMNVNHGANGDEPSWKLCLQLLLTPQFLPATHARDRENRLPLHRLIMVHKFNAAALVLHKQYLKHAADPLIETVSAPLTWQWPRDDISGVDDTNCEEGSLLHLALKYDAPDAFIRYILECVPRCVAFVDPDGDLPLHAAVDYKVSLDQLEMIVNADPSALKIRGDKGYLSTHLEAAIGGRLPFLEMLHGRYPASLSELNDEGSLPIHVALRNSTINTESLDFLHQGHPKGLAMMDAHGYSALHMACIPRKSAPVAISTLQWLLVTDPGLIRTRTETGLLPLHVLAQNSQGVVVNELNVLIQAFPQALQKRDADGDLPIHYSVMSKQDEDISVVVSIENVICLWSAYPTGIQRENERGQLALHIACANPNAPNSVIDFLCEKYPEGMFHYDSFGLLPFHYASTLPMLDHWMPKFNASILPTSQGNVPALFIACELDASLDIIFRLVECSKHLFLGHDSNGPLLDRY